MIITFESHGSFQNTDAFLNRMSNLRIAEALSRYGAAGVQLLSSVTPVDTGLTASSWSYEVTKSRGYWTLSFHNQNRISNGTPLVILLQYGHGTGTGGYVAGRDFINPAAQSVFDQLVEDVRKEVSFR